MNTLETILFCAALLITFCGDNGSQGHIVRPQWRRSGGERDAPPKAAPSLAEWLEQHGATVRTSEEGDIVAVQFAYALHLVTIDREVMQVLANLPKLAKLDLSDTSLKDDHLLGVKGFRSLVCLDLSRTAITDQSLRAFAKARSLRDLSLDESQCTGKGLRFIPKGVLQELILTGPRVSDKGLRVVAGFPNLRKLCVGGPRVTKRGILALKSLSNLEWLTFCNCWQVDDDDIAELVEHIRPCHVFLETRGCPPQKNKVGGK